MNSFQPQILKNKKQIPKGTKIINGFSNNLKELFFVRYPSNKKNLPETEKKISSFVQNSNIKPIWIYYKEEQVAVSTVPENIYFELRTARNKNIINKSEQHQYRNLIAGIAGLSVGSSIVSALSLSGGPKNLKIADFDTVELTNLNRIQASLLDFGSDKCEIAAKKIWALDPFAKITLYPQGLTEKNLENFLLKPKLNVFVDEMDSIPLKILARQICKKNKIPVLMATDNGEGIILDVERYDTDTNLKIFHGRLDTKSLPDLKNLSFEQWLKLANQIVGINFLSKRMRQSITEIGKNIPAVPQLGTSASLAGSVISLCLRKIASKQKLASGRYIYDLEDLFYDRRS